MAICCLLPNIYDKELRAIINPMSIVGALYMTLFNEIRYMDSKGVEKIKMSLILLNCLQTVLTIS